MVDKFNWIRPGYELVNVKLQWNVQVPFIHTADGNGQKLDSIIFSPQETPNKKWKLLLYDRGAHIEIYVFHGNSPGTTVTLLELIQGKMSILNKRGKKVLQKMLELKPNKNEFFE